MITLPFSEKLLLYNMIMMFILKFWNLTVMCRPLPEYWCWDNVTFWAWGGLCFRRWWWGKWMKLMLIMDERVQIVASFVWIKKPAWHCILLYSFLMLKVDLDLGNYERFLDTKLTRDHNITTGKIYQVTELPLS